MSIKEKYGLTDEGVRNVKLGAVWTAVSNLVVFAGVGVLFLAMGAFVDHLAGGTALPDIAPYAIGLAAFAAALFVTEYFAYYYQYGVIYKESGRLRIGLAERLRKLPLSFFGRRDLTDLTETIMGDVKTIEHAYSHVLPELYGAYIMLGVAAAGLIAFDWQLAIAALWSAPVALTLLFGARRALQPMMHATRMRGLATSEDIQEALECVREVRATNQEERYLEHIRADIDAAERQATKSELACGVCVNGAQIVLRLGIATTILAGSMLVVFGCPHERLLRRAPGGRRGGVRAARPRCGLRERGLLVRRRRAEGARRRDVHRQGGRGHRTRGAERLGQVHVRAAGGEALGCDRRARDGRRRGRGGGRSRNPAARLLGGVPGRGAL